MKDRSVKKRRARAKIPAAIAVSDHVLDVCFGRNCRDTDPKPVRLTMTELANRFSQPDTARGTLPLADYLALDKQDPQQRKRRAAEKDGEYIIAAAFQRRHTRTAAEVSSVNAFVGDIDEGSVTREVLEARLKGFQFIAYSSFSHQASKPRWRFLIPYASPYTPDQHKRVFAHMQGLFSGALDPHCENVAQLWYTPACPHDAVGQFEFFVGQGTLLDVNTIPDPVPTTTPKKTTSTSVPASNPVNLNIAELNRLRDALMSMSSDDRNIWIKVGLALRRELGDEHGRAMWMEWSAKSSKFDVGDALTTWNSLKIDDRDGVVTLGTVFHLAMERGWSAETQQIPEFVADFNRNHFMAIDGGKTWIFREETDPELGRAFLNRINPADFKSFYANKLSPTVTNNVVVMKNIGTAWIQHPARRSYDGLTFLPGRGAPPGHYNLWQGFPVAPIKGSWALMEDHIRDVICGSDPVAFEYLLNWMAFAIQHPDRPAGVAVVLKGARGTGKGKLASMFSTLFGQHALQITQSRHLTGNFNAHLRSCVFLFVDEALWAGDKAGENVLKGLITESTIAIENKGQNVVTVPNRLHIMMASNNDWVVPAGPMERRYFVLNVSDQHMQDHAYFAAIDDQMLLQGGQGAMMHDLLARDISGFEIRQVPRTGALDDQVLRSLDTDMAWWIGHLGNTFALADWKFQSRSALRFSYGAAMGPNSVGRSTETRLGMFLRNVVPGGLKKVSVPQPGGRAKDCYEFPDQQTCRQFIISKLGLVADPWV